MHADDADSLAVPIGQLALEDFHKARTLLRHGLVRQPAGTHARTLLPDAHALRSHFSSTKKLSLPQPARARRSHSFADIASVSAAARTSAAKRTVAHALAKGLDASSLEQIGESGLLQSQLVRQRRPVRLCAPDGALPAKQPTLAETLRILPAWVGLDIEIKYPSLNEMEDVSAARRRCAMERTLCPLTRCIRVQEGGLAYWPRNRYVDAVLAVVFQHMGQREVVFTCFDPAVCVLLQRKQAR
jgi:hypothetical protein